MNPFTVLTSKLFGGLSIALLLALGVQTYRVSSLNGDLSEARTEIAGWVAADEVARRMIEQQQAREDHLNKEVTNATNAAHAASLAAARPAADRFADAHRVPAPRACGGPAAPADLPRDPEKPDEAGPAAVVAVPRADYDNLVDAALQGALSYEYHQALIRAGAAVAE